jgi:hypothetical protein
MASDQRSVQVHPFIEKTRRILHDFGMNLLERLAGILPMMPGYAVCQRSMHVGYEMLLERHHDVAETLSQEAFVVVAERVRDCRQANELPLQSLQIRTQSRPILADKQRVTAHRVAVGGITHGTLEYPAPAFRELPWRTEFRH